MSADLKASFILKLEDQLSTGIVALSRKLEALAKLSRSIGLTGLEKADGLLDKLGASADGASRRLDGVGRAARGAVADVQRLAAEAIRVNSAGVAFVPPAMARAAMTAMVLSAGGAGMMPPGGGAPRMAPSMLQLAAPPMLQLAGPGGCGGMPLSPSSFAGGFDAGTRMAARFGAEVRGAAGQVRGLGSAMGDVAHSAMGAFATGFGLMEPIREYARYENTARHIAITAGVEAQDVGRVTGELMAQYRALALASGQSSEKTAEAANFLITTGIGKAAVDRMLPLVARAATAYNTQIGDSVQAVFSLKENLHVPDAELPRTISAMALAGKEGHFSFANFSQFLPNLAPAAATSGFRGTDGAMKLMAMLETSRRNAGTPGEAETNLRDFLGNIFSPAADKHFKEEHVDLPALRLDAERKGINPAEAVISKVLQLVQGKTDAEATAIIAKLFHNQQARQFLVGMRADLHYYQETLAKLRGADSGTIDHDFGKAADAPEVKLRQLTERLHAVVQRFGQGFASALDPMNAVLDKVLQGFAWMDAHMPGTLDKVLGYVGGILAMATVLGLLVPLFRVIGRGIMLVLTPLRWVFAALRVLAAAVAAMAMGVSLPILAIVAAVAAVAGVVYAIYRNWGAVKAWFVQLWEGVKAVFGGFYEFLAGMFTGDGVRAVRGLMQLWDGLKSMFKTVWEGVQAVFEAFAAWVDGWTGGAMTAAIGAIKSAWEGLKAFFTGLWAEIAAPFEAFVSGVQARIAALRNSGFGRALGMGDASAAGASGPSGMGEAGGDRFRGATPAAIPLTGEIIVRATGPAVVERTSTNQNGMRLTQMPTLGEMAGRD